MTRTYQKGRYNRNLWKARKGFAKISGHSGHCICRYDFGRKSRLRIQHNNYMKFHILPFVDEELKLKHSKSQ